MGNISPARGGSGFGAGPRGIGQQPWGGLPDSRNSGSANDGRGGGGAPQQSRHGGEAGSGDGSRHQEKGERGGGLMSFIFGGGQQEKQGRQTPQMVKLPQVGSGGWGRWGDGRLVCVEIMCCVFVDALVWLLKCACR